MSLIIVDEGRNNEVIANEKHKTVHGRIKFCGDNSRVCISRLCVSSDIYFEIGSNVFVAIGERCRLANLQIHAAGDNRITIGEESGFNGVVRLHLHEAGSISIGKACLIAASVDMMISDVHSIIELSSGRRLNPPADISIARHVWVAEGAVVLKGVDIGENSIIGARSVVSKTIPGSCVAAGNPARVVKTGVTWRHDLG